MYAFSVSIIIKRSNYFHKFVMPKFYNMKKIILFAFTAIILTGCAGRGGNKAAQQEEAQAQTEDSVSGATLNTTTIAGTYKGVLPCADCPGIDNELTLASDSTYVLKYKYQERGDKVFEETGTYSFSYKGEDAFVVLSQSAPNTYLIGDKTLTAMDMEGNPIGGDHNNTLTKE
jgi:uncharacterized lipoprotein NlpE involved in copper resistance